MAITLRAARINRNMTQREAAKELGISKGTLASYEQGVTVPTVTMAKKIAKLYGLTVDDIIFLPTDCA